MKIHGMLQVNRKKIGEAIKINKMPNLLAPYQGLHCLLG